jgi:hypothetical protein
MAQPGSFMGVIQQAIATGMANASIADVEAKLKEVDKANEVLSRRWSEMLSSPQATAYKATKSIGEWEQTQLIIDLENLLGKLAAVCIAQQQVLSAITSALKNLNKK